MKNNNKIEKKSDNISQDNEVLMKEMIKKEMLKRIEKRIDENDTVLIKNLKQMLVDKNNEKQ